jgi:alpha,alpha-trehalose-phosphate synthase [UDP-forming]
MARSRAGGQRSSQGSGARDGASALVIVANRLPVEFDADEGWRRAPGGLVSAMESVLRDRSATWVGWSGQFHDPDSPRRGRVAPKRSGRVRLVEVPLTAAEVAAHYDGFANGALWPNYHMGIVAPAYHRSQFLAHREVNARFAAAVAERAAPGARVWVHDYQLQLVPAMLRQARPDLRIGFFLHIPFPPLEVFSQIPWRAEIAAGLLGADVVGFQTVDGAVNFRRAAQRFAGATVVELDEAATVRAGVGPSRHDHGATLLAAPGNDRMVLSRSFPIGIRADDYVQMARLPSVRRRARQIRADVGDPELLLLGVDRLDYTKGIDVRIQAITELLLDGDLDPQRTAFIQVAPPTRAKVEEYQKIRAEVELLVSRANGQLGPLGTNPIHYLHQPMPAEELVALYRAADVMLVTPLRDGMNLVAKEYVASRINGTGALVLSEFTGAAEQMPEAWLVNPYDIQGMKRTIRAAVEEPADAAKERMRALRRCVLTQDVAAWAEDFLATLQGLDRGEGSSR